jgi:hypothetical protein
MKDLILVGEITSPTTVTSITLFDSSLSLVTPDTSSVISSGVYTTTYSITKSVLDGVSDTIYYLKVFNEIIKLEPVVYDTTNSFSFAVGSLPVVTDRSWLKNDPILLVNGNSSFISKVGLDYEETSTSVVLDSGENVVEWFSYSQGTISDSSSLDVGSGILLSWVIRKKNSSLVNAILLENLSKYKIEIVDDVLILNDLYTTTLILSESYQLFSIWFSPSQIKTWLDKTLKDTISI